MMGDFGSIIICVALVALWVKPLGSYMTAVYMGLPHPMLYVFGRLEKLIYRLCGVHPDTQMSWRSYAFCLVVFGIYGFLLMLGIFMLQSALPLNPQHLAGLPFHVAFSTAAGFLTGTDWQIYETESTLSYFSQTVAIMVQQFLAAATSLAVGVALCRGIAARQSHAIGNFWVDITRSILYILLPLSVGFGLILASQGVIQNYSEYLNMTTLEGAPASIAQGPVALQTAIKLLGNNGGNFFATNSAHPYENPNAITDMLSMAAMLLLPVAFFYTAGMLMRDRRQGWMLLITMTIFFIPLTWLMIHQEYQASPLFDPMVIDTSEGNMEGKETRFGASSSAFWGAITTATSSGASNAIYDSFAPLSNLVQMLYIQLGEVVYGGLGSGYYSMMLYVFMAVFIAGLMVGRTPEFLGKKLSHFDVKIVAIALLIPTFCTLIGSGIAVSTEAGRMAVSNPGPHGFSQILFAFSSASNNNGAGLGGLQGNTPFYNIGLGTCMFIGRYGIMICILALAGSFARKNTSPNSLATLDTHTPLFILMLIKTIILLGVLTYIPALALGPLVEHLLLAGML